jgi:outer membrane protein assembly factor BamB
VEPLRTGDPERVGPYRLLGRLGAGGMGVVYLGRSPGGRAVAVKVIGSGLSGDQRYRARFRREVEAARQVVGAFTAPVLDADPDAAEPWLATAYLPGLTLGEAIRSYGPMPPAVVRALGAGLAEALAAIHGAGVVHRDLKPENVMLTAGGPRVIDFGIARPESGTRVTRVGAPIGTPGFMSPEQVAGSEVGPPSDIFTLGAVLAYAVSGIEPFGQGPMRSRLYRVMNVKADLDGVGDAHLRGLVDACLAREPERRPSAVRVLELLQDLGEVSLQGTGWLPAPIADEIDRRTARDRRRTVPDEAGGDDVADLPTVEPPAPSAPKRRVIVAGIGVGVLASGGLGAVLLNRDHGRGPDPSRHPDARNDTPSRAGEAASDGPAPRATRLWKTKVSEYFAELFTAGGVLLARVDEDAFLALDPRTGKRLWKRPASSVLGTSGDVALFMDEAMQNLTAVHARSGRAVWTRGMPGSFPTAGAFAGRSAYLGHSSGKTVTALDVRNGRTRWTAPASSKRDVATGDDVVAAAGDDVVTGLDAGDGRKRWTHKTDDGRFPQFGGGLFVITDAKSTLQALRADDGRAVWKRPQAGQVFLVQPGGLVYTYARGGYVVALKTATGEPVWSRRLGSGEGESYGQENRLGLHAGTLYVGSTDRNLYGLDAETGRVLWSYGTDSTPAYPTVGIGGVAFTATRDGSVHALTPPGTNGGGTRAGP